MQSNPLVTVLLTHHLDENRKYLDLALKSLLRQEGVPFEVIVLADSETCPEVPDSVTCVHNPSLNTATKKVHFGVKMASPSSRYFFLHSDDVMLGGFALAQLVRDLNENQAIMNPLTNGDMGSRYISHLAFKHPSLQSVSKSIPLHADAQDIEGYESSVMDYRTPFADAGLLIRQDWVTFPATMIPRSVWERVGLLDEALDVRGNDIDYCVRAGRMGIPSFINFGAFAFHFGTKTLYKAHTTEEMESASRYLAEKYRD